MMVPAGIGGVRVIIMDGTKGAFKDAFCKGGITEAIKCCVRVVPKIKKDNGINELAPSIGNGLCACPVVSNAPSSATNWAGVMVSI